MNYKKILLIHSLIIIALLVVILFLVFTRNDGQYAGLPEKNNVEQSADKSIMYVDNEYREPDSTFNTYLESITPMVVYFDRKKSGYSYNAVPFREKGDFIGLTREGKEVVLDIPKIDFFRVSSIHFDKSTDTVYYIQSRHDNELKTQVGTVHKVDINSGVDTVLIDAVLGSLQYVDTDVLVMNVYGIAGEAVTQLYSTQDGTPLLPSSYTKSSKYETEYRFVLGDDVYQIVFDNYGGMETKTIVRPDGIHKVSFPVSSDSLKIYMTKIGTLDNTYIEKNNISASEYLRSVYDDQNNTSLYFTNTTGDIWPKGSNDPTLTLYPKKPVKIDGYYDTYYTMGNLYEIGAGKYAQMVGDGLVTFDVSDMSVQITTDRDEIDALLKNKKFVASIANYIEEARTPAACGRLIGSSFEYPRVLESRTNSWFAYCLR
jgi:hypothetical protein